MDRTLFPPHRGEVSRRDEGGSDTLAFPVPPPRLRRYSPLIEGGESAAALVSALLLATPALTQPVGDPVRGKQVFETMCTMCHAEDGDGQGPSLNGVVGRKAGTGPNFAYTDAIKASNLTWTPATLDTFLQGPMEMVPGTAMPQTVPDPAQRADVIAYLATMK